MPARSTEPELWALALENCRRLPDFGESTKHDGPLENIQCWFVCSFWRPQKVEDL